MLGRLVKRLALVAILAVPAVVRAADRFVSTLGDDMANTCLGSSSPCRTIGHAIAQSASGDVVKTAGGRYDETLVVDASTVLTLSGSWNTAFTSRDVPPRSTKLLGRLNVDAQLGVVVDVTVDGFLMTYDGGLRATASSDGQLTIRLANSALDRNRFEPAIHASAIQTSTLSLEIADSTISANRTLGSTFAAMFVSALDAGVSTVTVTDSAIERNFGNPFGTLGIQAQTDATGTLDVSVTRTRLAQNSGTGIRVEGQTTASPTVTLTDVDVIANRQSGISQYGGNVTVTNSVIARNRGRFTAGIIMNTGSSPGMLRVVGSTIRGNRSRCSITACSGGIAALGTVELLDTILWGNRASRGGADDLAVAPSTPATTVDVDHCILGDVNGSYSDLGGNLNADPLFASRRDEHLTAGSPAIDAGTCTGAPATDFDDESRPAGTTCDIGADEFVP